MKSKNNLLWKEKKVFRKEMKNSLIPIFIHWLGSDKVGTIPDHLIFLMSEIKILCRGKKKKKTLKFTSVNLCFETYCLISVN